MMLIRKTAILTGIAIAVLQTATAYQDAPPAAANPQTNSPSALTATSKVVPLSAYRLGPGDVIVLQVLDSEEISGKPVRVDQQGLISLPLAGQVSAVGLSTVELEAAVAKKLSKFIWNPTVSINVTQFGSQPISVLGAVAKPGAYQLQGPKSLSEVIALANGFAQDAGDTLKLVRQPQWGRIDLPGATVDEKGNSIVELNISSILNSTSDVAIYPHDLISVPKSKSVFVMGEVQKPGQVILGSKAGISVLEALSMAQGFQRTAAPKKARILRVRPDSNERQEIPVNLASMLDSKSENLMLKPDDILYVPNNVPRNATVRLLEAAVQMGTGVVIWRQAPH